MKSLLVQILEKAKKEKFMFRCNAYQLHIHGCESYVTDWHTDIAKIIDTMENVEMDRDNIHLISADEYVPYWDKLLDFEKKCYKNHEEFLDIFGKKVLDDVFADWKSKDNKYMTPQDTWKLGSLESEFSNIVAEHMLFGEHHIVWTNWGGNTGVDCFTDCDGPIYDYLSLKELTDKYEEDLQKFLRY